MMPQLFSPTPAKGLSFIIFHAEAAHRKPPEGLMFLRVLQQDVLIAGFGVAEVAAQPLLGGAAQRVPGMLVRLGTAVE